MFLSSLKLYNFRNIEDISLSFEKNNIIYGDNGQGKTNIIESIYLLYFFKSFRDSKNINFLGINDTRSSIIANIETSNEFNCYRLIIDKKNKSFSVNGKEITNTKFLRKNTILLYYPGEIFTFTGSSSDKRNFIDRSIYQVDPTYLDILKKFNFILKARNKILKEQCNSHEYQLWTDLFVEASFAVTKSRLQFVEKINSGFKEISSNIFETKNTIFINLDKLDLDCYRDYLFDVFHKNKNREYDYGYSLYGPQTQNVDFFYNGKSCKYNCSQGELRIALLIYKFLLRDIFKSEYGYFPVFLLDDFSSFIDQGKFEQLINYVNIQDGQFVFTDTSNVFMGRNIPYKSFEIVEGDISFN